VNAESATGDGMDPVVNSFQDRDNLESTA